MKSSSMDMAGRWCLRLLGVETGIGRHSKFAALYDAIHSNAKEIQIVDYHTVPDLRYRIDLNQKDSISKLRVAIDTFKPEVILCMETLEHVNYHFEAMNEMARAVELYGSTVFITIPNNGNWFLNALGWNADHSIGFFKDIAYRFVTRSDLGKHKVKMFGCFQQYFWFWRVIYWATGCQPFSWAFLITPK